MRTAAGDHGSSRCFDLRDCSSIYLIGGGGKTSLMFALAHDLAARGERVITTTTTRILSPPPRLSPQVVVEPASDALAGRLRHALGSAPHVTAARARLAGTKLLGFAPEQIDELAAAGLADRILVEADGSAGRSLKAHADHEPVISDAADMVIAVVGVDCIGRTLDDRHVHRAAIFSQRLGLPMGTAIAPEHVAAIVLHPYGYLSKVPSAARVVVLLNKAVQGPAADLAMACADALCSADHDDRIERILTGAVGDPLPRLGVAWRRETAHATDGTG